MKVLIWVACTRPERGVEQTDYNGPFASVKAAEMFARSSRADRSIRRTEVLTETLAEALARLDAVRPVTDLQRLTDAAKRRTMQLFLVDAEAVVREIAALARGDAGDPPAPAAAPQGEVAGA